MVVKILSSSGNFAGVKYNEQKNNTGQSELLVARNFNGVVFSEGTPTKADYVQYLKATAATNDAVKNRQFHAVISTKGREHTPEQLRLIAEKFLDKMGYADNPYLIYAHHDTAHNHVHIVSSRVNKEGKKIDDSFEKLRAQKAIQEILGIDPKQEVDQVIQKAMTYNLSTSAQLKLLFEAQGYTVRENQKSGDLSLIKYGKSQAILSRQDIDLRINAYQPAQERIRQLKAIFHKYQGAPNDVGLVDILKERLGLDLVFHTKEGHNKPYGYTVVDHTQKNVFKGSEILALKLLLGGQQQQGRGNVPEFILEALRGDSTTFYEFSKRLAKLGYSINQKGEISSETEDTKVAYSLSASELGTLKENTRLHYANSYTIIGEGAKEVLAGLFQVADTSRIQVENISKKEISFLKDKVEAITDYHDTRQGLYEAGLEILKSDGQYFVLDKENKYLASWKVVGTKYLAQELLEPEALAVNKPKTTQPGEQLQAEKKTIQSPGERKQDSVREQLIYADHSSGSKVLSSVLFALASLDLSDEEKDRKKQQAKRKAKGQTR